MFNKVVLRIWLSTIFTAIYLSSLMQDLIFMYSSLVMNEKPSCCCFLTTLSAFNLNFLMDILLVYSGTIIIAYILNTLYAWYFLYGMFELFSIIIDKSHMKISFCTHNHKHYRHKTLFWKLVWWVFIIPMVSYLYLH